MIKTNHNCKTSRMYKKKYEAQCTISDHYKQLNQETEMKDLHKVSTQSVNEIAQLIDAMVDREEAAQKERLAQFDKIEKEIGEGVFKLSELQDLARKHAALLPF